MGDVGLGTAIVAALVLAVLLVVVGTRALRTRESGAQTLTDAGIALLTGALVSGGVLVITEQNENRRFAREQRVANLRYVRERAGGPLHLRRFDGVDLRGENLSGLSLADASFRDADLRGVVFVDADLRSADFTGARLDGASFYEADLRSAAFVGAQASSADFERSRLNGADFTNAMLNDAVLTCAVLSDVDFRSASSLDGATTGGVEVFADEGTFWPAGSDMPTPLKPVVPGEPGGTTPEGNFDPGSPPRVPLCVPLTASFPQETLPPLVVSSTPS